jgi:hypothetical protein
MAFRGVAHVHSTFSFDGQMPLTGLADFLASQSIAFALLSEHVESLDAGKLKALVEECERLSTETLLLVPGVEIDNLHALFYNVSPVTEWRDETDLARQLAARGSMVVVSHPVKIRRGLPSAIAALFEGVEIWNARYDGKLAADIGPITYWQELQRTMDRHLAPLCGIDLHNRLDFTPLALEVECDHLDARSVLGALRSGQYRIMAFGEALPVDFKTGRLTLRYRVYSGGYHFLHRFVYRLHRTARWLNLDIPKPVKSVARRVF